MTLQGYASVEVTIMFRPRNIGGQWYAWVRRGESKRLDWWPVSEKAALVWYAKNS